MQSSARKIQIEGISQEIGRVLRVEGSSFRVRTADGDYRAIRALSCLVEPIAADIVLLVLDPKGGAYVLAVLERVEGEKTTIAVEGDLDLRLASGRFAVAAQEGIDLVSAKDVSVVSNELRVNAALGNVVVQRLSLLSSFVRAEMDRVKVFAQSFDSILDRLSLRAKRSYRTIDEIDQVRAETIDYTAKSTMNLHGENALITAEELVKVDGEQIHLG